jgi:hypothetical protein
MAEIWSNSLHLLLESMDPYYIYIYIYSASNDDQSLNESLVKTVPTNYVFRQVRDHMKEVVHQVSLHMWNEETVSANFMFRNHDK